ncbi:hypothetical protein BT93_G2347 [Corymbia citriodora subsp. variegata]|nr:hypothetical protein BT93_G2347 [Corymbia citriodora subsp. variegata]
MATSDKLSHPLRSLAVLALLCLVESAVGRGGFTTDLIHRDSPSLPFHDSFATRSDRMRGAAQRSISRARRFWARHSSEIQSEMAYSRGEYYMKVWIGSPPIEKLAIADTGSDLSWTQCEPCVECYSQKQPIFNPRNSSTYKTVQCLTRLCQSLVRAGCGGGGACKYNYTYGDGSFTSGDVAVETFRMGAPPGGTVTLPRIVFGCGYDNVGIFTDTGSGIIGLGGGPASLITQTDGSFGGQFGYCLVPEFRNGSSKISFGEDAAVSGPGTVSTPLFSKSSDTYHIVNLEGFSIGKTRFSYRDISAGSEAKESVRAVEMMIDSGTTLTFLPSEIFHSLESAVVKAIPLPRVPDPKGMLGPCYRSPSGEFDAPVVTLHFAGGADIALNAINTFMQFTEDLVCFTMKSTDSIPILGNLAQMEFKVGFNVRKRMVSFMASPGCTAR